MTCECGKRLHIEDPYVGESAKCPHCARVLKSPAENTTQYDVFISYSTDDKMAADATCAALESNGVRCWIAPRDILPGRIWGEAIISGIECSSLMVLLYSARSNDSSQVMREVERAVAKRIPIITLRLEDIIPSKTLEYFISSAHWLDALTPPLTQHLVRLSEAVKILLSQQGAPAALTPQFTSPESNIPRKTFAVTILESLLRRSTVKITGAVVLIGVALFGINLGISKNGQLSKSSAPIPPAAHDIVPTRHPVSKTSPSDAVSIVMIYQHEEREKGEAIAAPIESAGYKVCYAPLGVPVGSEQWVKKATADIKASGACVLLLTEKSVRDEAFLLRMRLALEARVLVFPVFLDSEAGQDRNIIQTLERIQGLRVYGPDTTRASRFILEHLPAP